MRAASSSRRYVCVSDAHDTSQGISCEAQSGSIRTPRLFLWVYTALLLGRLPPPLKLPSTCNTDRETEGWPGAREQQDSEVPLLCVE